MTSKLIEKTVVLPKKDRITESINASPEDIGKLFKMKFLVKLAFHLRGLSAFDLSFSTKVIYKNTRPKIAPT